MSAIAEMKQFANGALSEDALQAALVDDAELDEFTSDTVFMQECEAACLPTMIQMMMLENADAMDEAVVEAFKVVNNYMVGQGLISEAAAINVNNPKINVVRLNRAAQIKRLTTIIELKMGRRQNHRAYKKYKLGQKIKKANREELHKVYGARAEKLAKKLWFKTHKSGKIASVVASSKKSA